MSYHASTKALVRSSPKELGARLGKLAVNKGLSVIQIALLTGASRTTVYSWFAGNGVTNAYKYVVKELIKTLQHGSTEQIMELKNSTTPGHAHILNTTK